ncbi:unnamed protein product [Timema podura]|uniref:Uncharacterized protein n=1 Tax=Timema podura TaxID=61482 RepID=A0ABN7P2C0_TIMPD|nr:unnamed protein product [Timema podura]
MTSQMTDMTARKTLCAGGKMTMTAASSSGTDTRRRC